MIQKTSPVFSGMTPGRIADSLNVPLHRVQYVLRSRPHIKPRPRAGRLRVFDQAGIDSIRKELAEMDRRQAS